MGKNFLTIVKDDEPETKPAEADETLRLTMIRVWEELDEHERNALSTMCGIASGQMALTKISTILKAIAYKHGYVLGTQSGHTHTSFGAGGYTMPAYYGTTTGTITAGGGGGGGGVSSVSYTSPYTTNTTGGIGTIGYSMPSPSPIIQSPLAQAQAPSGWSTSMANALTNWVLGNKSVP